MIYRGKAWKFGDDVDTDVIIPAKYLSLVEPGDLARHCMEPVDPDFASRVRPGDVMVAGKNFGCGSSREHAPIAIRAAGISCVIARSFARIFFRNAINLGLPVVESRDAWEGIEAGDEVEVDSAQGIVRNLTRGASYPIKPLPAFAQRILQAGGLIPYVRSELSGARPP